MKLLTLRRRTLAPLLAMTLPAANQPLAVLASHEQAAHATDR